MIWHLLIYKRDIFHSIHKYVRSVCLNLRESTGIYERVQFVCNTFNISIIIIIMESVQNRGGLVLCLHPGAPSRGWWSHPSAQGQHPLQGDEREPEAQPAALTPPAATCMDRSEERHHLLLEPRWDAEDPQREGIHPAALGIWLYFVVVVFHLSCGGFYLA